MCAKPNQSTALNYKCIDSITIEGSCRLRKVISVRSAIVPTDEFDAPGDMKFEQLPKQFEYGPVADVYN